MKRTIATCLACCVLLAFASSLSEAAPPPDDASAQGSWLGVRLDGSNEAGDGVKIALVMADSPAHRMGLRAQDVILAVDGEPVHTPSDVVRLIQSRDAGAWVSLSLERRDEPWDMRLRLTEKPADLSRARALRGWLGVLAIDLPPALREHFGAPREAGVMVSEIAEGSPAVAAGLELGDVIFEIDGQPVTSAGRLSGLIGGSGIGNEVELRLAREGLEIVVEPVIETTPHEAD